MRRPLSSLTLALFALTGGLIVAGLGVAAAPAIAAGGQKICTITDDRMTELSGLVTTESGYVAINDGTDDDSRERIFFLDSKCKLRKDVPYSGNGPRDPEDLALSADGTTLWIADIGANVTSTDRRTSVVLWSLPVDGSAKPVLHRLTYPGKTPDAEALLIGPDNVPLIITKTMGNAEIYRPSGPLQKDNTEGVPLVKVGEVTLPKTTTSNILGQTGRVTITGAARSPDGKRVVLRTYADAFEWDLPGGDVLKALTRGTPRATALADPFGEAITYSPDGRSFRTVSDFGDLDSGAGVTILGYTPATKPAAVKDPKEGSEDSGKSWIDELSLDDITYLIASVGVVGAVLVGAGIFGILRARRRSAGEGFSVGRRGNEPVSARAVPESGRATPGGTYSRGAAPSEPAPVPGGSYRGRPAQKVPGEAAGRRSSGVYGAAPANGTTYGSGHPHRGQSGGGGLYGGGRSGGVYGGGDAGGSRQRDPYPDEGRRAKGPDGGRNGRRGSARSGYDAPPGGDYDYR